MKYYISNIPPANITQPGNIEVVTSIRASFKDIKRLQEAFDPILDFLEKNYIKEEECGPAVRNGYVVIDLPSEMIDGRTPSPDFFKALFLLMEGFELSGEPIMIKNPEEL